LQNPNLSQVLSRLGRRECLISSPDMQRTTGFSKFRLNCSQPNSNWGRHTKMSGWCSSVNKRAKCLKISRGWFSFISRLSNRFFSTETRILSRLWQCARTS
jgi:hypothetical protein